MKAGKSLSPPAQMTTLPRIAYIDCFSGASGNMFLGALLHAGFDISILKDALDRLQIGKVELLIEAKTLCSINGIHIAVKGESRPEYRHLSSILSLLNQSGLTAEVVARSAAIFQEIALAESRVHGIAPEEVHFHEIGAIDTIVDVVGSVLGLHSLGISRLCASPIPLGRGQVRCAHGILPLPAPAVCELLRGLPVYGVDIEQELVTPTGAALLKVLVDHFGPMQPMQIETIGYGAGSLTLPDNRPDLLRLIIGQPQTPNEAQEVEIIETNLDDWNPEGFPYICDLLFSQGALDVSLSPLQMKKGRPGFRLQVIADQAQAHLLKATILSETSAIGLRFRKEQRLTLERETIQVETPWGKITAKKVRTPSGLRITPEYEACRRIASQHQVPLQHIYLEVYRSGKEIQ